MLGFWVFIDLCWTLLVRKWKLAYVRWKLNSNFRIMGYETNNTVVEFSFTFSVIHQSCFCTPLLPHSHWWLKSFRHTTICLKEKRLLPHKRPVLSYHIGHVSWAQIKSQVTRKVIIVALRIWSWNSEPVSAATLLRLLLTRERGSWMLQLCKEAPA